MRYAMLIAMLAVAAVAAALPVDAVKNGIPVNNSAGESVGEYERPGKNSLKRHTASGSNIPVKGPEKSRSTGKEDSGHVFCTSEGKVCPDGTVVAREPPDCKFAPCPEVPDKETSPLKTPYKGRK